MLYEEASTSKPRQSKRSWCQIYEPKAVVVEEIVFEIQIVFRVVSTGFTRRFLYRQLLSINKSFPLGKRVTIRIHTRLTRSNYPRYRRNEYRSRKCMNLCTTFNSFM